MMESLKPYSEYKETGQAWIGTVPAHWEVRPAFGVYQENLEKNKGLREKTVLSLSYGRIVIKAPEKLRGLVPESFETYQIVNPGYIVIRTTDLQNDHTSLRIGFVKDRGIITSAYLALKVKDGIQPEFGCQILNVWDLSKAIYGYGSGLRQNLSFGHFKRMLVAVPPRDEQESIVKFLNYMNWRVDRAIKAKRKTIALLNEQKQAIIHRAVTRGISPTINLKSTGLPWVSEIPEHWSLAPNRSLMRKRKVLVGEKHSEYKLLSLTKKGIIILDIESGKGKFSSDMGTSQEVRAGDLIFCLFDVPETPRTVGLSKYDGMITGAYTVFECADSITAAYLDLFYRAMDDRKLLSPLYSGLRNTIPPQRLLGTKSPLPPSAEREVIVSYINEKTSEIDRGITKFEQELELLSEYRTSLTSDVVTGKLDVLETARNLPMEIIPDPSDDMGDGENEEEIEEAA